MAKRKLTPAQELQQYVDRLNKSFAHWEKERRNGCVDPNWSDGVNLNLVRGHIIAEKRNISRTCNEFSLTIPAIYYRPLPPEMPADFFVTDGKNYNPQRIARIMNLRGLFDKKETEEEESKSVPVQLTLF
ncbi:MAG: hypothetical protein II968_00700 [Selenomonadaceae bacterium]|nr:hypothetical protein [Selenomonadaceae bacterium]